MASTTKKHSYTITCAMSFRDRIERLAARRRVNVGDLARSVLLMVPGETIANFPDPGEPKAEDRETVILKSGTAKGRIWRRKPRLQVRMSPGVEAKMIRRALAMALAMEQGELDIYLEKSMPGGKPVKEIARMAEAEVERLRTIVSALSFDPLPDGIKTRDDALHVLGFAPGRAP
ncbi:MAG: J domain-containing protein, partial [Rhodospirillales bacterium]